MTKPNDEANGYEEIVEKVFPKPSEEFYPQSYIDGFDRAVFLLKKALTSGLLCDGKELEERYWKGRKDEQDAWVKKLSGSCEGLTVEEIESEIEDAMIGGDGKIRTAAENVYHAQMKRRKI